MAESLDEALEGLIAKGHIRQNQNKSYSLTELGERVAERLFPTATHWLRAEREKGNKPPFEEFWARCQLDTEER